MNRKQGCALTRIIAAAALVALATPAPTALAADQPARVIATFPAMAGLDSAICPIAIGQLGARRSRSVRVDGRVKPGHDGFFLASAAKQSPASDFQTAYAAAQQDEQQAAALHDRWTPTEAALKQAKQAADAKHYDAATALAREAEALAQLSIQQAREQETAWHDAVVH